jgi:hypothetical protein
MDDTFLHFRCYLLGRDCPNPVWAYATNVVSVDYTVGTGVTTSAARSKDDTPIQNWLAGVRHRKYFAGKLVNPTMHALILECKNMGLPISYCRFFRMREVMTNWDASGTIMRLLKLPLLIYAICVSGFSGGFRKWARKWIITTLCREFFGLHVGALICAGVLKHGKQKTIE